MLICLPGMASSVIGCHLCYTPSGDHHILNNNQDQENHQTDNVLPDTTKVPIVEITCPASAFERIKRVAVTFRANLNSVAISSSEGKSKTKRLIRMNVSNRISSAKLRFRISRKLEAWESGRTTPKESRSQREQSPDRSSSQSSAQHALHSLLFLYRAFTCGPICLHVSTVF